MKPKAQTMSQKFGFMDPDLTTPKHDAIMLWLDGEIEAFAKRLNGEWSIVTEVQYRDLNFPHTALQPPENIKAEAQKRASVMKEQIIAELSLSSTPRPIISKVWESPIIDRTYTIGFCDMVASWKFPYIRCSFDVAVSKRDVEKRGELLDHATWQYTHSAVVTPSYTLLEDTAHFEVKPSIPSLGEVIRQVRMYQTYTRGSKWWIVSPDTRFRAQIEAQGIGFLEVPSSI